MALDFKTLFSQMQGDSPKAPMAKAGQVGAGDAVPLGTFDDTELLDLWARLKKESLDDRWVFERQWHRNILYVLGRQWIEYYPRQGGWKDKRMAQWIPRPVTNKCKEVVQAIRAMFASIKLGVNVRPNGANPPDISAAATADDLAPMLHEEHHMDDVLNEGDFWFLVNGNMFIHTFLDYDIKYGVLQVNQQSCVACGETMDEAVPSCPTCQGTDFQPATDEQGLPVPPVSKPRGRAVTIPLSPLEVAFPNTYARFEDIPYIIRLRWRTKSYFENHPTLKAMVPNISWAKSPTDQSLQLFKSLAQHNDLGVAPAYLWDGSREDTQEGIAEYEVWYKPCDAYPKGLVFRVIGDKDPQIIHLENDEAIPGEFPYQDASGQPLFTFSHAGFEQVGGRLLASGPIDVIVQKQDQLNQLDSMTLLIIQRMSNPVWLEPKGAEVERLTGMPGLVIKWNPLTVGGNAKPERIPGIGPDASLFTIREQYLKDIEELAGTFDILKGAKPTGVEAFSALQLLVERSQARFASAFTARGQLYRDWFKFAIELEREFGPDERTKAVLSPSRTWTFQNFKRANLQGSMSVMIEDGTAAPKTSLGMRAALEHANQLGMLDMNDPDQKYEGLKLFGLTRMAPTLDIHVQAALQKQQAFEEWAVNRQAVQQSVLQAQQATFQWQMKAQAQLQQQAQRPGAPVQPPAPAPSLVSFTPLKWHPWYNPQIHRQEFLKWANGDRVRELLQQQPSLESILAEHLQEMESMLQQMAAAQAPPPQATATSGALGRSNTESTSGNEPQGTGQGAQSAGPR